MFIFFFSLPSSKILATSLGSTVANVYTVETGHGRMPRQFELRILKMFSKRRITRVKSSRSSILVQNTYFKRYLYNPFMFLNFALICNPIKKFPRAQYTTRYSGGWSTLGQSAQPICQRKHQVWSLNQASIRNSFFRKRIRCKKEINTEKQQG